MITILNEITETNSACPDGFKNEGHYDGIVRLNDQSGILGIIIKTSIIGYYDVLEVHFPCLLMNSPALQTVCAWT